MTAIDMTSNHYIVAIMHDNLRRSRTGASKHCPDGRSQNDHSHISLLCFPRARRNAGAARKVSRSEKF